MNPCITRSSIYLYLTTFQGKRNVECRVIICAISLIIAITATIFNVHIAFGITFSISALLFTMAVPSINLTLTKSKSKTMAIDSLENDIKFCELINRAQKNKELISSVIQYLHQGIDLDELETAHIGFLIEITQNDTTLTKYLKQHAPFDSLLFLLTNYAQYNVSFDHIVELMAASDKFHMKLTNILQRQQAKENIDTIFATFKYNGVFNNYYLETVMFFAKTEDSPYTLEAFLSKLPTEFDNFVKTQKQNNLNEYIQNYSNQAIQSILKTRFGKR